MSLPHVSLDVSLKMATYSIKIDRTVIEKFRKQQRNLGRRITLADTVCPGLKLVINAKSSSWVYTYRKRGYRDGGRRHPQRTMKLGDPSTMSVAEARLRAEEIKAQVRSGEDPALNLRREIESRLAAEARRVSIFEWAVRYQSGLLRKEVTTHIKNEVRNVFAALDELHIKNVFPEEVTAKHLRELIEQHSGRPATSRQRFGAMSRFLAFLVDEEVISLNPATLISRQRRPKPPSPRTIFFNPFELRQLWHADWLKPEYKRFLRFMITTPLRANEGASLRWSQLFIDEREVRLSASETKNAEHFVMPLSKLALEQLMVASSYQRSKIFQLSREPDGEMTAWTNFNKAVRRTSGVENFGLHHLRRTFSSLMADYSDVSEGVVDGLLNHKQSATRGGVIRHYQHAKQVSKRREVMHIWGDLLEGWL